MVNNFFVHNYFKWNHNINNIVIITLTIEEVNLAKNYTDHDVHLSDTFSNTLVIMAKINIFNNIKIITIIKVFIIIKENSMIVHKSILI